MNFVLRTLIILLIFSMVKKIKIGGYITIFYDNSNFDI